jgi:hypothetical protein
MGRPYSVRTAWDFTDVKVPPPHSMRAACNFLNRKLPGSSYSIRTAFTTPSWAGRERTLALPSSVLMMAPRVRMFRLM